jgi:hypothetical protein
MIVGIGVLPEYFPPEYFPQSRVNPRDTQVSAGFAGNRRRSFPVRKESMMENSMVIASKKMTSVMLGVFVCALGISVSSSADARKANRQPTYVNGGYPNPTPSITVMPRNTPKANIVCWTPCGQPGAIVMGADPDPSVRAYLLRDASGYFGGGGR